MQHPSQHDAAALADDLTVAELTALLTACKARRPHAQYRHEQREELSGAKREQENQPDLVATVIATRLHTATISAHSQAFATVIEALAGLVKSLTPARAAAYAAAILTLLHGMHLIH